MNDLTGQKVNKLTVLHYVGSKKKAGAVWLCLCECGKTKEVISSKLISGSVKSCGCLLGKHSNKSHTFIDLTGQKFGHLTAISRAENYKKFTVWLCLCDCGEYKKVEARHLRGRQTRSCGCKSNEMRSNGIKSHGLSRTKTYKTWSMMKSRCDNPNYTHYDYYGGRGIKVCKEWYSFENFLNDMGERPGGTTLDRIDSSLGYFKENCRWASSKIQSENKRNSRSYTIDGETKNLNEWADLVGTTRAKLYNYMYRYKTDCLKTILIKLGLFDKLK